MVFCSACVYQLLREKQAALEQNQNGGTEIPNGIFEKWILKKMEMFSSFGKELGSQVPTHSLHVFLALLFSGGWGNWTSNSLNI